MRQVGRVVVAVIAIVVAVAAIAVVVWPDRHKSTTRKPDSQRQRVARRVDTARSDAPEPSPPLRIEPTAAAISTTQAQGAGAGPRPRKPTIIKQTIPFPQRRKQEMAAYSERHYGRSSYRLTHPKVIVEHFTVNDSVHATYNTFASDQPDVELHELPNVCSHFVIARDGKIVQLVPLGLRCRHTVGLNWTAIGIEHVGFSDRQILHDHRQLQASLRLTTWLRCHFGIAVKNVIGHNESLTSPYHREHVASLRHQTHADWTKADMDVYRADLRKRPACP